MSYGILSGQPGSYDSGILGALQQPGAWDSGVLGAGATAPLFSMQAARSVMPAWARAAQQRAAAKAAARARGTHGIGALPSWATPMNIGLGAAALLGGCLLFGALKKR